MTEPLTKGQRWSEWVRITTHARETWKREKGWVETEVARRVPPTWTEKDRERLAGSRKNYRYVVLGAWRKFGLPLDEGHVVPNEVETLTAEAEALGEATS